MNIAEQFNRSAVNYDKDRRAFIPCFDEFYLDTTDFIISELVKPRRILDLGAGTGLLASVWYERLPEAQYLLIDIAQNMLEKARERFSGADNVAFEICDYTEKLPGFDFDAVISSLSIHHIEDAKKRKLFSDIYSRLSKGQIFVNYDQFIAGDPKIENAYSRYWTMRIKAAGVTEHDQSEANKRRRFDRECSVETELEMLREAGFNASCVYLNKKFAVLIAGK